MNSRRALESLSDARARVREALQAWDASDVSAIERCNAMVEGAAAGLREIQSALAAERPFAVREARAILADLERDAKRMWRIVDACQAFQRGLELRLGEPAPAYSASGAVLESHAACHSVEA